MMSGVEVDNGENFTLKNESEDFSYKLPIDDNHIHINR
jgi:hypothetical protein